MFVVVIAARGRSATKKKISLLLLFCRRLFDYLQRYDAMVLKKRVYVLFIIVYVRSRIVWPS